MHYVEHCNKISTFQRRVDYKFNFRKTRRFLMLYVSRYKSDSLRVYLTLFRLHSIKNMLKYLNFSDVCV